MAATKQTRRRHFLDTPAGAYRWAKRCVTDLYLDEPYRKEQVQRLCRLYSERFNYVKQHGQTTIHRAVTLDHPDQIVWDRLGNYWSFKPEGVGDYGNAYHEPRWPQLQTKGQIYILTAQVQFKGIDWPHGFTSFLYYGTDQWECAIEDRATLQVTAFNGQTIDRMGTA